MSGVDPRLSPWDMKNVVETGLASPISREEMLKRSEQALENLSVKEEHFDDVWDLE